MKRRWLFTTLLVGALAVGITGGTVLAQESGTDGSSPMKSFAARVATILGLDEAKVQDAMKQASKEIQDEALQKKLDNMVAQGRITQAQADDIYKWYQSRPDVLSPGFPFGGMKGYGFHRGRMWGGGGWHMLVPPTATPTSGSSGATSL